MNKPENIELRRLELISYVVLIDHCDNQSINQSIKASPIRYSDSDSDSDSD